MDKYFHPTFYNGYNYLSMLGLKLKIVNKRGHFCLHIYYIMIAERKLPWQLPAVSIRFQIRWRFRFTTIPCPSRLWYNNTISHMSRQQSHEKTHGDQFIGIWMRANWNFHRIWITMNPQVKWAPVFKHCRVDFPTAEKLTFDTQGNKETVTFDNLSSCNPSTCQPSFVYYCLFFAQVPRRPTVSIHFNPKSLNVRPK